MLHVSVVLILDNDLYFSLRNHNYMRCGMICNSNDFNLCVRFCFCNLNDNMMCCVNLYGNPIQFVMLNPIQRESYPNCKNLR